MSIEKRIRELADRSYNENRYVFTDFLNMSELSTYYEIKRDISFVQSDAFGGTDGCERCVVRFGSEELCGYIEEYPIVLLKVRPVQAKFADKLSHRDFLGSVIGLGLEREKLGDIFIRDNVGYIFVLDTVSDYIIDNLTYVKHTKVRVEVCEEVPEEVCPRLEERSVIVSSNRLDGIISKIYNLSRDESLTLIQDGKVFVNGRVMTGNAKPLKQDEVVSVRGFGRFIFAGEGAKTRKDKLYVNVQMYV